MKESVNRELSRSWRRCYRLLFEKVELYLYEIETIKMKNDLTRNNGLMMDGVVVADSLMFFTPKRLTNLRS